MSPLGRDLLALVLSCAAGILVSFSWVKLSRQTRVVRSLASYTSIAVRVTIFYGLIWSLACYGMNCPVRIMGAATTFVVLLSLIVDSNSVASTDIVGFSIGMTLLSPILITKLFVFGVIDDEDLRLPAPSSTVPRLDGVPLGALATVLAPLKSSGTIEVNGCKHNASSQDGAYIPSGTSVVVCGERQGVLLVRCLNSSEKATPDAG